MISAAKYLSKAPADCSQNSENNNSI